MVDPNIRKLLLERVAKEGADSLNNLQENPIWLNRDKNIDVKKVTVSANGQLVPIHHKLTKDGQPVLDENGHTLPNDFVATGNNHHATFFRRQVIDAKTHLPRVDETGQPVYEYCEQIVTLLEAVERAQQGLPVIDKNYKQSEGWQFLLSLKINEYVVFPNEKTGFNPKEIDLTDINNYALISPNLFRVQKMSQKYYNFRHHLDTTTNETAELRDITWKRSQNLSFLNDIVKVRVNHIGRIVSVGEN